jgi:hypothetical protein
MARNISTLQASTSAYQERSQASRLTSSWSEKTATAYQTIATRVQAAATALSAKEKAINGNANLSPTGQFDAVKQEVVAFLAGLKWLQAEKGGLETKVGGLFGDLFILPDSKLNEIVQALRDAQSWSAIGALQPSERDLAYLRFCAVDNTEVIRALQNAPMPLISDDILLRGSADRAARLDPQRYQTFIETGQLLDEVSAILTDCLDLGQAFGFEAVPVVDALGEKVRTALDFSTDHPNNDTGTRERKSQREAVAAA